MRNSPIATNSFFERIVFFVLNLAFPRKDILSCLRQVYLRRWVIFRLPSFGLFIHKFERSDEDRGLHDHPWDFIVIPLWRGYIEHRFDTQKTYHPKKGHFFKVLQRRVWPIIGARIRPARYAHRVELLHTSEVDTCRFGGLGESPIVTTYKRVEKPAWSLFIVFRRKRIWGFFMPQGWMNTKQYHAELCDNGQEE